MTPRERHLLNNFKLTPEIWQKVFDYQRGLCAICGHILKKANTDHDHATGEFRGILCARCNRALGRFADSVVLIRAALAYLLEPPARAALGYIHLGYPGRVGTKKHRKTLKKLKKIEAISKAPTQPLLESRYVNHPNPSSNNQIPGNARSG